MIGKGLRWWVAAACLLVSGCAMPLKGTSFFDELARRECPFYRPGVAFDGVTGMSYDGHGVDFETGELRGAPRNWSAASKESLHLILLIQALQGKAPAVAALGADPLPVLEAKVVAYERFDARYPGFGGFLPWYEIQAGEAHPLKDWQDRVPALDNGQLGWSLYLATHELRRAGHAQLARRYEAQLARMKENAVRVFFDPEARKIRGVARLLRPSSVPVESNAYGTKGYFIEDPYEGILMAHFMDLFGDWRARPADREAFWARPLRRLIRWERHGAALTVEQAWVGSSHEQWGFLILPYRDVPLADRLFLNFQRARTWDAARRGWPGLRASTHRPVRGEGALEEYVSFLGVEGLGREASLPDPIFAPYAAFPLALADRAVFSAWLKRMLEAPGMWGPYGIGESFAPGGARAPLLTWDGKALPLIASMGGVVDDVRAALKRDGLYEAFLARVRADYDRLGAAKLEGESLPFSLPR
jgi:hypothetical protein